MSTFEEAQERDVILFVGSYLKYQKDSLIRLEKTLGKKLTPVVIIDSAISKAHQPIYKDSRLQIIEVDSMSAIKMQNAIKPIAKRVIAVTIRAEKCMPLFKKIAPFLPYVNAPSSHSLGWTTDKIKMRQLLRNYDKSIAPKFLIVRDATQETIEEIKKKVGFPLIIKPSGLAKSLLVSICYHQEELEDNLKNTVNKIHKIYKKESGRGEPGILVEEYMEGSMYS